MRISLISRKLSVIIGLNRLRENANASMFSEFKNILLFFFSFHTIYDLVLSANSYSESEYFKQTMRQSGPTKPKEPRIPRMPQLYASSTCISFKFHILIFLYVCLFSSFFEFLLLSYGRLLLVGMTFSSLTHRGSVRSTRKKCAI